MSSSFGKNIRISIFGQSHASAVGVVIDGLPAGHVLDMEALTAFVRRRSPAANPLGTRRCESDELEILSGVAEGRLCGAPLAAIIRNTDAHSGDYAPFADKPRPGHADFTAAVKYGGAADMAGGGHFSGRLTAPLVIAGGICLQLLHKEGIRIGAHLLSVGNVCDTPFDPIGVSFADIEAIQSRPLPVIKKAAGEKQAALIKQVQSEGDSIGGVIECAVLGLPAGLGDPMFEGLENRIAHIVFGIPAVKGIEFGSGFACAAMRASEHNDPFAVKDGKIVTSANHHGGILGGISTGMPLLFKAAVKPTPSIAKIQTTVSLSRMETDMLEITGRHDPCIALRAVPCVEAAAAIAVYDAFLEDKMYR